MRALDRALSVIPELPRPLLERFVECAIERLDAMDGDADAEPCPAGDDGCHYFDNGWERGWGSIRHGESAVPIYGEDQSKEPIGWRY